MSLFLKNKSLKPDIDSLRLNFWGKVSMHPSDKAFPVCNAFGHQFYVGPVDNNKLSPMNPVACPAWHVPVISASGYVFLVEVH